MSIYNQNYQNETIERKYLNNMKKNHFLKVKNSLLELEKRSLKNRELKDKEAKIKREIEELKQLFNLLMIWISLKNWRK